MCERVRRCLILTSAGISVHRPRKLDQNGRKAEDVCYQPMLMTSASESGL
jgi:hypothetical protein